MRSSSQNTRPFAGWLRANRGSTLVEFAFVFPILFALIVGIFEFGRLFYIDLTLHGAAREASRFGVTGNVLPDPNNPGEFLSRLDSIVARIQQVAPGLGVTPGDVTIVGPNGAGDTGGPGDVVTIQVRYQITLLTPLVKPAFPGGVYHSTVTIVSQNELFDT